MNRLLTFRRARTYALVFVGLFVVAWIYELSTGSPPTYGDGVPIGGDYIAFHAAGRLVLDGRAAELYDRPAVIAVQDRLLGGHKPGFYDAFRNPPFAALPFVPLAPLDLVPGFAGWSLLSLSCLGLAIWLLFDEAPELKRRWRGLLVLVFGFAPVYFGLIDGENATVSLLLYVLIYRALVRDRDSWVGFWAAVGLFKPQLFFVFPIVLIARHSWRGMGIYVLTGFGLAILSTALVGVEGMRAWLRILVEPESGQVLVNAWRMASLKSLFDGLLSGSPTVALGAYVAVSAFLLGALYRVWRRRRRPDHLDGPSPVALSGVAPFPVAASPVDPSRLVDPAHATTPLHLVWIVTSLVAVLVDPHLVDYDLTVLVPAGALAAIHVPAVRWWMVLLYVLLVFRASVPVGEGQLQLSTLVLVVCLGLVWSRIRPLLGLERFSGLDFKTTASA